VSPLRQRVRRFLQQPGTADLSKYRRQLAAISTREDELRKLSDDELPERAEAAADDLEFCAVGREAGRRALGERAHDVQLLGTLVMLRGMVAEMATGEGKTLAGALAAARYALLGHHVHVVAVNDYLARRDAEWMSPVYKLLGVSVGWITQDSTPEERREAYRAEVTYAPVSELGFDVLRDRLVTSADDLVTAEPDVALIDEADSVLIDEALVPLVLAGTVEEGETDLEMAEVVRRLLPRLHYQTDNEGRNVHLTDRGAKAAEHMLGKIDLYAADNVQVLTRLNVALHAEALLRRDVDYIVSDGKVRLINSSRGRVAQLQRWPDGLQAAVEAKEAIAASDSGEILDSITVESLIRRYPKVCGMTGTAVTVGEELRQFYSLEVAVIPPNQPVIRDDEPDRLYDTAEHKHQAVIAQVSEAHEAGRPVLIGTLDIAESERLSELLEAAGLTHVVLNAKNDAQEAAIIADAGQLGAITVSTQMAGRGTDIRLGGRQNMPGGEGDTPQAEGSDDESDVSKAGPDDDADADDVASAAAAEDADADDEADADDDDADADELDADDEADEHELDAEDEADDDDEELDADDELDEDDEADADDEADDDATELEEADQIGELGGLYVIGTGRHASRRLDDQLRGRAGRQGDPGGSVFFVSMEDELITAYAPETPAPTEVEPEDGWVDDKAAHAAVSHAQRVAEGVHMEVHRNTYRYNKLIDDQRRVVLEHRDRFLRTDAALVALGTRCPERYEELSEEFEEEVLVKAARQIVLYHLDRGWADHLAELADLREGIHLRALGHGHNPFIMSLDPLTEFHSEAVKLFSSLLENVEEQSADTFKTAEITEEGVGLDAAGLKRPSATWTYVVQDNPFGTAFDRALRWLTGKKS
jgi:preprotein translocase subunit SecA